MKDYKYLFNNKYPKALSIVVIVLLGITFIILASQVGGDREALTSNIIH